MGKLNIDGFSTPLISFKTLQNASLSYTRTCGAFLIGPYPRHAGFWKVELAAIQ